MFIFILGIPASSSEFVEFLFTFIRFHEEIKKSLERRRADVVELSQNLTEQMADIHNSIIQCMSVTLSELKRSNATVSLCSCMIALIFEHLSLA
jgi:hypothetical protein